MSLNLRDAAAAVTIAIALQHNALAQDTRTATIERTAFVMGTTLRISASAASRQTAIAASEQAFAEVRRLEGVLSSWQPGSEVGRLNAAQPHARVAVSSELYALLAEADTWVRATDGAFDPAIGALVDAWGFRHAPTVPSASHLAQARAATGWSQLALLSNDSVQHGAAGWWLDTGGFGKGAALRNAVAVLRGAGVTQATLDFGGQLAVFGAPARVAVADPRARATPVRTLVIRNASVATSSQSERYIDVDGRRYGHILDPHTGKPVRAWGSVTVVAADPLTADALSTALFVMGPQRALAWAGQHPDVGVLVLQSRPGAKPRAAWSRAMNEWIQEN